MDSFRKKQLNNKYLGTGCTCKYCESFRLDNKRLLNKISRRQLKRDLEEEIEETTNCEEPNEY